MPNEQSHLDIENPIFDALPHVWVQWKGTDVCCDVHCHCGHMSHYDGDFMYFIRCPKCKTVWEVGTHIRLYEVSPERLKAELPYVKDADDD